jgi:hypothetical protein
MRQVHVVSSAWQDLCSLDDAADIGVAPPMMPILNQSEKKANDPKVLWACSTRFWRKH